MKNYNTVWDEIFEERNPSSYPFDNVVSFLFRNYPKDKPKEKVKILEVGCGGGNNMWFASREGFDTYGIDGSKRAIEIAKKRFLEDNLNGNFIQGDFTNLPYEDNFFDIVIDRCSIVCVNKNISKQVFSEIFRVMGIGGSFFFNSYADNHTSCIEGLELSNGITTNINSGSLVGNGDLSFFNRQELLDRFSLPWKIISMKQKNIVDLIDNRNEVHAEWELILEKVND